MVHLLTCLRFIQNIYLFDSPFTRGKFCIVIFRRIRRCVCVCVLYMCVTLRARLCLLNVYYGNSDDAVDASTNDDSAFSAYMPINIHTDTYYTTFACTYILFARTHPIGSTPHGIYVNGVCVYSFDKYGKNATLVCILIIVMNCRQNAGAQFNVPFHK